MKKIYIWMVSAALLMGMYAHVQLRAGSTDILEADQLPESNKNVIYGNKFNGFSQLYDPVYEVDSPQVVHPPLKVEDPQYDIPRGTPFFRCYFKKNKPDFKFEVKKASISYEFVDQAFSHMNMSSALVQNKKVQFSEVFSGIDVQYTIREDSVLEEIIVYEMTGITEIVQKINLEGVTPVEEGKGIYFTNGEKYLFGIPPPVMYELDNPDNMCTGLHYELKFENNQYFLKKVIDEQGITWLHDPDRNYPVVIDATTQSFEDAWEAAGLKPYGQYFENISEYISPATGALTVKQTDFFLPGRGIDLEIARVYTTPAVFNTACISSCLSDGGYQPPDLEDGPHRYECPPVDVGNGWTLNFPWIGWDDYLHFKNGTMYKTKPWDFSNHTGHHFTFEDNVLYAKDGVEYHFSGNNISYICDPDGNTITFSYSGGKITSITDTVGRVVTLNYYGDTHVLKNISYGSYTVTYAYDGETLQSVTDPLGRVTTYHYDSKNYFLLTDISYPAGGTTHYTYGYFAQEGQCLGSGTFLDTEYRKYHVTNQAVYEPSLAKNTVYSYQGDFDGITTTTVTVKNEHNSTKRYHQFDFNSKRLTTAHTIYDTSWNELAKTQYMYTSRNEVLQKDVYKQGVYCYTEKFRYDSWGNVIYQENGEGEKVYSSYANTNFENVFRDDEGDIAEFSNIFYDNDIESTIHSALVGSARKQGDKCTETYCQYDSKGHIIDIRQVFQGMVNSSTFKDVFDESGSTSFVLDLTGVSLKGDAVLKVHGVPHTNYVTKTETHSTYKYCNWLNDGYWQGKYFYAEYVEKQFPYEQGYEKVGPFDHYPGTAGYQNYTKWVSVYDQYVKTTYREYTDKYPAQIEYKLNGNTWKVVSPNLDNNTVYHSIPAEEFISGENTLYFRESSSWTTECEWVLYVPHAVSPIEDVSTSFAYDQYGNVISTTDSENNTTILQYDTEYHAYLTTITNALNNTITAAYDMSRGFLTSITDFKGNTTFFEYDILGRVTKKIHPDQTELEAVYDDQNNITTIYNELDNYTKRYYDGIGRLIKQEWYLTDTDKLTETYEQSYLNKIKKRTDPEGDVYTYEYDVLGRNTKIFNPDSSYKEIQYTDFSNTVTIFDENQHKTAYQYNWVGQLVQVQEYTDATNYYVTEYAYAAGQLTSMTDANGNTTSYDYNSLFGATKITYPDLTTEIFFYDAVGNVIQKTDSNGTTTFEYDAVYQLTTVEYPDQSVVTFEYNANGNRTAMTDYEGQTSYTYDTRGRLLSETRTIEEDPYTISYSYDAASRLVSFTYPDRSVVTYEYDSLNRLVTIPGYAEFTYNDNSLLSTMSYSNDVITSFQYDNRNRPVSLEAEKNDTDFLLLQYQYDAVGNITQLNYNRRRPDNQWVQSTEIFQYDGLDRLVSAQGDYGLLSYTYDPAGNRLSLNDCVYTYNDMNELVYINDGASYTYDDKGNMKTKIIDTDTWSYTYDTRNQLTQVEKNQTTIAQYTYDGNCRRIKKTEWIESLQEYHTKIYVYSGTDVIYEKNLNTGQEATYIHGQKGIIAKTVNGLAEYYTTDHLGSTRLITDENGTILSETEYTPFGSTDKEESFLYTGKEKDSTGLYYYGARYYDSDIGRFITRDPLKGKIESPQTLNRYSYCLNNPLKYVDPHGLDCEYVILPDGTISYELADLYNKMQKALDSMTDEEWEMLDELLDTKTSTPLSRIEAVKFILKKAGIDFWESNNGKSLTMQLGGTKFTIGFSNQLNIPIWGDTTKSKKNSSHRFILLSNHIHTGGDLFLVLGHELAHAYMIGYESKKIESVKQKFGEQGKDAFMELISYQWEFSVLYLVPNVTPMQKDTIIQQYNRNSVLWFSLKNPWAGTIV